MIWVLALRHIFWTLPNDKIFDKSKLEAFADEKLIATQILKFMHGKV